MSSLLCKPLLAALFACLAVQSVAAQSPGPLTAAQGTQREQIWRIPAAGGSPLMVTTVMRPPGERPRPLVVINHGSPAHGERPFMTAPRYPALSSWFVERGFVVVMPLRRGYGETGGDWVETYGSCETPDYYNAGLNGAADIEAAIAFMRRQPFVAADRTIVVGESAGGWAALALSRLNPRGIAGLVSLAGGRGGRQLLWNGRVGNCTPDALVKAAGRYGATARVPTLWIYAENDSFFSPLLARRMFDAYTGAGGRAALRMLPAFEPDGHMLLADGTTVALWSGALAEFLGQPK